MSKPIAVHPDGTNCYTKNCKRRSSSTSNIDGFLNNLRQHIETLKPFPDDTAKRLGLNTPDKADEIKRLQDETDEYFAQLEVKDRNLISRYAHTSFRYVNDYLNGGKDFIENHYLLRKGNAIDPEEADHLILAAKRDIPELDRVLATYTPQSSEPRKLYRALRVLPNAPGGKTTKKDIQRFVEENYKVGETIANKAYTSTSADSDYMLVACETKPEQVIVHEIISYKGVPIYRSRNLGSIQSAEKELLIPRDATFRVVNIIEAEYVSSYPKNKPLPFKVWGKMPQRKTFTVVQLIQE